MLKLLHILPGAFESDRWQVGCPFFLFFTVPCNFVIALQGLCLENILGWHFYCWCLRRPTPLFCHWSRYRERLVTPSSPAFHSPETSLFSLCWSRERELTQRFQQGHKISAVAKMYSWKMLRSKESQRSSWQGTKVSAVLHFTCLIKASKSRVWGEGRKKGKWSDTSFHSLPNGRFYFGYTKIFSSTHSRWLSSMDQMQTAISAHPNYSTALDIILLLPRLTTL